MEVGPNTPILAVVRGRDRKKDLLNDFAFKPDVVEESQPILEQFNDPVALHI